MATRIEELDVTALVNREGFKCPECKHKHAGRSLDYICVGCPCDLIPDFEKMAYKKYGGCTCMGHNECDFCQMRDGRLRA